MSTEYILAIDCGTQSIRAMLVDPQGNIVHKKRMPIEPYFSTRPGWAEQHADHYWENLCAACQGLWEESPVPKEAVIAVALTTQRATVVCVDKEGRPLRPAIVWLDQRRTTGLRPIGGLIGLGFKLVGMAEAVAWAQAEAEVNWIRTHEPDVWARTHKYLFLSGYLTYRLTGRFVDSVGCQVGYVPFDYKAMRWCRPGDWKWQAFPVEREKLPELVPPAQPLGQITPQASEATGIPQDLSLIAAAADKACEVLGAGCLRPGVACLSYGTTAVIETITPKYTEVIRFIPPYPSAVPGAYNTEVMVYRGYWMVSWFKQEFGLREQRIAEERGIEPEDLFDELVNQVPPGSHGLILQPYWSPGLKQPEARGAIIGFGDVHTRAHLYRAILEGIAYALRDGLEATERATKTPISEVRVAGGGSRSDAAMQITADIFNRPAVRPHTYETSGLGAAIDAAVGVGLYPDFETAVREMTRVGQVFTPDPHNRDIYEGLYSRVYRRMYRRLKPLYEEIRAITAYMSE